MTCSNVICQILEMFGFYWLVMDFDYFVKSLYVPETKSLCVYPIWKKLTYFVRYQFKKIYIR